MNDFAQATEVPGYRLVHPVGRGGASTVYQAMQRSLERQVAVKVFEVADPDAAARCEPLLRTNARLSHPHIVGVHQAQDWTENFGIGNLAGSRHVVENCWVHEVAAFMFRNLCIASID